MQIIQLHSMGGCGTHLIQEMYERLGTVRLTLSVYLLQAMHLARRAPDQKAAMRDYCEMTAADAVSVIAGQLGIQAPEVASLNDDELIFRTFGAALRMEAGERCLVAHHYFFSHAMEIEDANGGTISWSEEDCDGLQDLLERAAAANGADLAHAVMVRNPVDIHFSSVERFGLDVRGSISLFFRRLAAIGGRFAFDVVKYEELCRSTPAGARDQLCRLRFSVQDLDNLDLSVIHGGSTDKWILQPAAEVRSVVASLAPEMAQFGYKCVAPGALRGQAVRLSRLASKYASEFRAINRILAGDYSADAAFSRHRRSLPARIWFRVMLSVPSKRRNLEIYYRTRKGAELAARPLSVIAIQLLRRTISR
jgi:hypothetical protein